MAQKPRTKADVGDRVSLEKDSSTFLGRVTKVHRGIAKVVCKGSGWQFITECSVYDLIIVEHR